MSNTAIENENVSDVLQSAIDNVLFECDDSQVQTAFAIALKTIKANTRIWENDHGHSRRCILAGAAYNEPWTRDAALNSWYALNLLDPEIASNTLLSVLDYTPQGTQIGGQYWDAIIWVTGAWDHYLSTGNRNFLDFSLEVTLNALKYFEVNEFDERTGLFRGGACFQDGVSGYPKKFTNGPTSGILEWVDNNPDDKVKTGHGLPLKALSTNCLYYNAYQLLGKMADTLGVEIGDQWQQKAASLKDSINHHFWNAENGTYEYLADDIDDEVRQEGFGNAFAILFGVADELQTMSIIENQYISPHGITCLWPTYQRYLSCDGSTYGRHSGMIWPQVNAAWAMAAARNGRIDLATKELSLLAEKVVRDDEFVEVYHPGSGQADGGFQEAFSGSQEIVSWGVRHEQTWCATGYIRMVMEALLGLKLNEKSIEFKPVLPENVNQLSLDGIQFRRMLINLTVYNSQDMSKILIDGEEKERAQLSALDSGERTIEIYLPKT